MNLNITFAYEEIHRRFMEDRLSPRVVALQTFPIIKLSGPRDLDNPRHKKLRQKRSRS